MPLTPYEIHNKEFKRTFRGYDVDEVNDFLDQIIKDFELLTREKLELEQEVEELRAELREVQTDGGFQNTEPNLPFSPMSPLSPAQHNFNSNVPVPLAPQDNYQASVDSAIHRTIRMAQQSAEEHIVNARKEADLIVQQANADANRITNDALRKMHAITSEVVDLKQKATIYRARFRTLVQSHMDVLENSDWGLLEEMEMDDNLENRAQQIEQFARSSSQDLFSEHASNPNMSPIPANFQYPGAPGAANNMRRRPEMDYMAEREAAPTREEERDPRGLGDIADFRDPSRDPHNNVLRPAGRKLKRF